MGKNIKNIPTQNAPRKRGRPKKITGIEHGDIPSDLSFFSTGLPSRSTSIEDPLNNPVIYAAMKVYATNISSIPLKFVTSKKGKNRELFNRNRIKQGANGNKIITRSFGEDYTVVENSPLIKLFDDPNPLVDGLSQFIYQIVANLVLDGEVNIYGDRTNVSQLPEKLWVIPSKELTKPYNGSLEVWNVNSKLPIPKTVYNYNLIRPRFLDPRNPTRGLPPWKAAIEDLIADKSSNIFLKNFYDNNCVLGGLLIAPPGVSKTQGDDILNAFEERHRGANNSFRVALARGITDFKQFNVPTTNTTSIIEQKKYARRILGMVFGIPPTILGDYEDINYATAQIEERLFYFNNLIPVMRLIEDVFWSDFFQYIDNGNTWAFFDLSAVEALQENLTEKLAVASQLSLLGYPTNMINKRLGLGMDDIPWGDTKFMPLGSYPAELFIDATPPEEVTEPVAAEENRSILIKPDITIHRANAIEFDKNRIVFERKFLSKYKRWLYDLRKNQLATIHNDFPNRALDEENIIREYDSFLFDEEEWNKLLREMTEKIYVDSVNEAINLSAKEVGSKGIITATDPRAIEIMLNKNIRLSETTATLRENIAKVIADQMNKNASLAQVQAEIRKVFNFQESRALMIARTEIGSSMTTARYQQFRESNIASKSWLTAGDGEVRGSHSTCQAEGEIAMDKKFNNGLLHPGDYTGSAGEIVNCRCTLVRGR